MTLTRRGARAAYGRVLAAIVVAGSLAIGLTPSLARGADAPVVTPPVTTTTTTTNPNPGQNQNQNQNQNVGPARGASDNPAANMPPGVYDKLFKVLFSVFVVAVILESALAVIFNWRIFLLIFDRRGVKTIISVALGLVVAYGLKLDVLARVYAAVSDPGSYDLGPVGYIVTALILAGGSAGVNSILRSIGFREIGRTDVEAPKPPPTKAWLSVRLTRDQVKKGPVYVLLSKNGTPAELAGEITGLRSPPPILRPFVPDEARFPPVAGHVLDAEGSYILTLTDGAAPATTRNWGPYVVAPGAIIDLDLTL